MGDLIDGQPDGSPEQLLFAGDSRAPTQGAKLALSVLTVGHYDDG